MDMPQIKSAGMPEKDKVLSVLTLAFAADPFMRWVFPDASSFLKNFSLFTSAIAGKAFEGKTAFYTEDYSAASLWLAPGVHSDEDLVTATLKEIVPENLQEPMMKLGEEIDTYHPADPYWYLADIGVDAKMQGRGRGALMLKHMLQRCDEEKTTAFLESSNPRNISIYERHGFEVMGEIRVGSPEPLTPMIRAPR